MQIKEIMTRKVITVKEDDNVRVVCKLLIKHHVSGFPVVSKSGKLTGFISERDVIAAVYKPNFLNRAAKQLMSRKVRTVCDSDPLINASKIFSQEKYRHLPVLKNNRLVGIVARRDVVRHMMGQYY